jgi:RNA polymerase sigma factor (sigma-70 family)
MIHAEQLKIIQNLMLKYQDTKEKHLFEQILERIDDLLVGMVHKIARIYHFTAPNIQDLYQCAIIGVYKTIDSIKSMDDPNYILARIYVYVRKEVFQEYGEKKIISLDILGDRTETAEHHPPDEGLVREERIHFLTELLMREIITQEDLDLLILRFVEGQSVRKIVEENKTWGKSRSTVSSRIDKTLKRIREHSDEESLHVYQKSDQNLYSSQN